MGGAPSSMSLCSSVNGRKRPRTSSTFFLYSVSCGICRPPDGPQHTGRQACAPHQALRGMYVVRASDAPRLGHWASRPGVQSAWELLQVHSSSEVHALAASSCSTPTGTED